MDLLLEDELGEWEVVDYKTSRPPEDDTGVRSAYGLQLGLYALAAARWLGRPPARWGIYFLGEDVYQSHPVVKEDLDRIGKNVEEILARLAAACYDSTDEEACRTCDVRAVCQPTS